MANTIYTKETNIVCPRCKSFTTTISTYHFGATYKAECSKCGLGQVTADNEEIALARLNGCYLEYRQTHV